MPRPSPALFCLLACLASLLGIAGCGQVRPGRPLAKNQSTGTATDVTSSHVLVIMMENEEATSVIGNPEAPYENALARRYGVATRSYAMSHPSLPNYLALTSGSTQGITSDCTDCRITARNIVDQLEAAGISWKAYMEDIPTSCFRGAEAGGYAKRHDPFIYYEDIAQSSGRCSKIVGFGQLRSDLAHRHLPTYAWITPNLCDDGHNCGVEGGDRWLKGAVPALIPALGPHGFLILTWDEGTTDDGCCGGAAGGHIATIVIGPDVRRDARDNHPIDTYGVLGTIEEALGLPPLGSRRPRQRPSGDLVHPPYPNPLTAAQRLSDPAAGSATVFARARRFASV